MWQYLIRKDCGRHKSSNSVWSQCIPIKWNPLYLYFVPIFTTWRILYIHVYQTHLCLVKQIFNYLFNGILIFEVLFICITSWSFCLDNLDERIRSSSTLPVVKPETAGQSSSGSSLCDSEDRCDIIKFYNTVYVKKVQSFVRKFTAKGQQVK